jgi:hypothetical protein
MKAIYRISDSGYKKNKPYYVKNRNVFLHFLTVFKNHDIYLFADNVSEETYLFLTNHVNPNKIIRTSLSNAGSFMFALQYAMDHFQDEDKVYFAEDDYIYTNNAPTIIEEGLDLGQYSSGYDHPDKYINHSEGGSNPFVAEGGELTRVLVSKSSHWKFTNSCCMTFATTVKILKKDLAVFQKYCSGTHPHDFQLFCELIQSKKGNWLALYPAYLHTAK